MVALHLGVVGRVGVVVVVVPGGPGAAGGGRPGALRVAGRHRLFNIEVWTDEFVGGQRTLQAIAR